MEWKFTRNMLLHDGYGEMYNLREIAKKKKKKIMKINQTFNLRIFRKNFKASLMM